MSMLELRRFHNTDSWRLTRIVVLQPIGAALDDAPALPPSPVGTNGEPPPMLDDDGLLRHLGRWVAIPHAQVGLVRLLLDHFQSTVSDDALLEVFPHDDAPDPQRKLAGALHRLRSRVCECGLTLARVRGRGYILDHGHATVIEPSDKATTPSGSAANL
jgi:hypothetical protein